MFKLTCDLTFPTLQETYRQSTDSAQDCTHLHGWKQKHPQYTNWSGYHHIRPRSKPHNHQINNNQKLLAKIYEPARSLRHENMQAMPIPAVARQNPIKLDRSSNQGFETAPILPLLAMQLLGHGIQLQNSSRNRFSQCNGSSSDTLRLEEQRNPDGDRERRICAGQEE